jgi:hypothetical protein
MLEETTNNEVETKEPPPNPRQEAMDAILKNHSEKRIEEVNHTFENDPGMAQIQTGLEGQQTIIESDLPPSEELPADEGAPIETEGEENQVLAKGPLEEYIVIQDDKPFMKTVINGVEQLMPLDTVQRNAQIESSARIKMEESANYRKELETYHRQLDEKAKAIELSEQAKQTLPPESGVDDQSQKDIASKFAKSLYDGDESEVASNVLELLNSNRTPVEQAPVIDQAALVDQATQNAVNLIDSRERQKVAVSKKADAKKAFDAFAEANTDMPPGSTLFKLADLFTEEIVKENPGIPLRDLLAEGAARARAWRKGDDAPTSKKPAADLNTESRQQMKRELVTMPNKSSQVFDNTAPVVQAKTMKDVMADIKKARGQPT